jgi:hypothetical protein
VYEDEYPFEHYRGILLRSPVAPSTNHAIINQQILDKSPINNHQSTTNHESRITNQKLGEIGMVLPGRVGRWNQLERKKESALSWVGEDSAPGD